MKAEEQSRQCHARVEGYREGLAAEGAAVVVNYARQESRRVYS
jgi:hypothetical protein